MLDKFGMKEPTHLSDEELLLFAADEISKTDADQVRRHLSSCAQCRSREVELKKTFSEFADLRDANFGVTMPSGAGPRALLKARLDAAAMADEKPWWGRFVAGVSPRGWMHLYAALGVAMLCVAVRYRGNDILHRPSVSSYMQARPVPDSSLTPGVTRPVGLADICPRRLSDLDPVVSPSIQKVVFKEYGIGDVPSKDYQVDYLINPQLGGTDDIRNLWPQPYGTTVWNAHAKDALEDRLYQMVCEKQIDLASAQRDIARDWISAYKKYFHTSEPV
jgi:hypothetical protein